MAEEMGRVVLISQRGSGRSAVANWLVSGELEFCHFTSIDSTSICKTYVGRGWTVVDTMGFGEPLGGTIPDEYARRMVIDFLNEVKGRYSHIFFVVEVFDVFNWFTRVIRKTFVEIFPGGEKNFVVLLTKVHDPSEYQRRRGKYIEEKFPECKQFLYVRFPGPSRSNAEEANVKRRDELERLEMQMKEMSSSMGGTGHLQE